VVPGVPGDGFAIRAADRLAFRITPAGPRDGAGAVVHEVRDAAFGRGIVLDPVSEELEPVVGGRVVACSDYEPPPLLAGER